MEFVRHRIPAAVTIAGLEEVDDHTRVVVGGVVTHRQRPSTAQGTVFVNLEDETGILNVICSEGVWARHRKVARASAALLVRGMLERSEGVTNLIAERIDLLPLATKALKSRDFR
jgi:error-prone DNA polymerase